ncbi:hypothetical protein JEQ12_020384, partial [Ovis aries]
MLSSLGEAVTRSAEAFVKHTSSEPQLECRKVGPRAGGSRLGDPPPVSEPGFLNTGGILVYSVGSEGLELSQQLPGPGKQVMAVFHAIKLFRGVKGQASGIHAKGRKKNEIPNDLVVKEEQLKFEPDQTVTARWRYQTEILEGREENAWSRASCLFRDNTAIVRNQFDRAQAVISSSFRGTVE